MRAASRLSNRRVLHFTASACAAHENARHAGHSIFRVISDLIGRPARSPRDRQRRHESAAFEVRWPRRT